MTKACKTIKCKQCGKLTTVTVGNRGRPKVYCSVRCRNQHELDRLNAAYRKPEVRAQLKEDYKKRKWALRLKRQYGIGKIEYYRMLVRQNGACALCGRTAENEKKRLAVDHDHRTGKVRGLLCHACNTSLHDSHEPAWYLRAYQYLNRRP